MNKKDYRSSSSTINYNNNRSHADEYYPEHEYPPHSGHIDQSRSGASSNSSTTSIKAISPDRKHRRNTSSASSVSVLGTPRSTPRSSHDYLHLSPFPRYSSPERQSKHNRYPSIDYASELSPFPYYSPERKHQSLLSSTSYDSLFPNPAIKSPTRTPRRAKEKYVSFQEDTSNKSKDDDHPYCREEDITSFPTYSRKPVRYWEPNNSSATPPPPKVTPSRLYYRRYPLLPPPPPPPPPSSFRLPTPKRRRTMSSKTQENSSSTKPPSSTKQEQTSSGQLSSTSTHVIAADSAGVEVVLKQQQEEEKNGPYSRIMRSGETSTKKGDGAADSDVNKNDTPPREKNLEKGKKSNVISPPEGQSQGHNRSASYNTADYGDLPNVPDSPYSPFHPSHHPGYGSYPSHHSGYPYAPSSPFKGGHKSPKRGPEDRQGHYLYSPHFGYPYLPPGYEEHYRDASPGKRQRLNISDDVEDQEQQAKQEATYPDSDRYSQDPYPQHPYFSRWVAGGREDYTEAYDSSDQHSAHGRQKHGAVPAVSKASSYPPPPSPPGRYDAAADSSNASYPGARRSHVSAHGASSDYSYGQMSHPPRGHEPSINNHYDYHESGYYPDPRSHGRYPPEMSSSGGPRNMHSNYYYHDGPPHDEVHPLLRDYDPERDRRMTQTSDENATQEKQLSPDRTSTKADAESVATTPSLKSRSSKATSSPSKQKPSHAAKAAIAAGMTQPPSAREVDFDIHNPPLEPITHPSADPVCSVTSNVNNNDVLCGRGGGTNTQIGNRRFRALVQEFQPTYLLCRRKEKPLIARTIVLIIRNRGGRFLKKDDANGMLFEVGDRKAEAKTSQALREGLDVRASKSTTIMGRKKKREEEKNQGGKQHQEAVQPQEESSSQPAVNAEQSGQGDDVTMSESPHRAQRDGPPPQHEYPPYHPPHYFYGYGSQYPPYHYGYETNPSYSSPSRKRQRSPPGEQMYYPPPQYNQKGYPPFSYPHEYHYPNYPPPPAQQNQTGEDNSMWETDFNPPRGSTKKDGLKREQ